jgi:hypothetical protein
MLRVIPVALCLLVASGAAAEEWGHPAARVTVASLGAIIGGAGVGLLGAALGCRAAPGPAPYGCLGGGLAGACLGIIAGVPLGVLLGASAFDPNGYLVSDGGALRFGGAFLGALLGLGVGGLLVFASADSTGELLPVPAAVGATVALVGGSVLGFELTLGHQLTPRVSLVPAIDGRAAFASVTLEF